MSQQAVRLSTHPSHAWPFAFLCAAVVALLMSIRVAHAGEARKAVKATHGEIVLLRTVPTRPATRMQPPGTALIVDPRPNRELQAVLGQGSLLNDAEIAALSAGPVRSTTHRFGNAVTQMLAAPSTGGNRPVSPDSAPPGTHPMGAIGQATRGIGTAVQQAMGAIPVPTGTR